MSRPPLSPAQAAAVEHPFEDACVTAGAGSGKTRVLAERYVHVVHTFGLAVRDVAALTFTEKAASEMRARIAQYFEDAGDERARGEVEFAPISTIHAFCARLLRLHAIEAGIDPSFAMLDAGEAALLREDAALLAQSRLEAEAPDAFRAYRLLGSGEARDTLMGLLDRLRGSGLDPQALEWISGTRPRSALEGALRAGLDALSDVAVDLPDAHTATVLAVVEQAARLLDDTAIVQEEDEDEAAFAAFRAFQVLDAVTALKMSRKKPFVAARKEVAEALEGLGAERLDAFGRSVGLPHLRTLLVAFDTAYRTLKHDQSALDFTDLELQAVRLLERLAAKGQTADLAPKALLVDEFQDTNPLQARLLGYLRATAPQFSVGDPKQSIYRFRRADVGVIVAERERVGAAGRHELATSYRAHPELVRRLNAVGRVMFDGGAAGVPYEDLEAGAAFDALADPLQDAPLRLTVLDVGAGPDATEARRREAAWIAASIRDLVQARRPRTKQGGGPDRKPLAYGDVAILFRARTDIALYEQALGALDIPYLTLKGQGYLAAEEIADLLYLLRVIHNPADNHALACAATGPALAATDADLLRWFRPTRRGALDPAWARMVTEAQQGGAYAGPVLAIEALRAEAALGHLAAVVEGALDRLGLLEVALHLPGGERRAANLRKAIDMARRMEAQGQRGLGDLLRHLATLRERAVGEAEAAVGGEDEPVVRLMTVHGSKGLEYPVVYLADIGRRPVIDTPVVHFDGECAIAARLRDPLEGTPRKPAGYVAQAELEQRAADEEALRLFYVATTRAEERLIMTAWCKGANKGDGKPKFLSGWGRALFDRLGLQLTPGEHVVPVGATDLRYEVVEMPAAEAAPVDLDEPNIPDSAPTEADHTTAAVLLSEADRETRPLGNTRFVVTVSELLAFAASPPRYYEDVVLMGAGRETALGHIPLGGFTDTADPGGSDAAQDPSAARRLERQALWDEPAEDSASAPEVSAPLNRAALGRAVHAVLETWDGGAYDAQIQVALLEEYPAGVPTEAVDAVTAMVARFAGSDAGRRTAAALAEGAGVHREVDFHTRVRFPGGETVGGFDSLLVKGSIDLWLPGPDGVEIIDYKTNARSRRFGTPEALGTYYHWQLRLYALAAERLLGHDVAGASLLLLDGSFGADAVTVPIDIAGEALRETRALCRAFALAELEGRYPADWRALLG